MGLWPALSSHEGRAPTRLEYYPSIRHTNNIMDPNSALFRIWDFLAFTAVPFVVVLGIMIFVHELGHFLAARLVNVRVLVFKLGFGRYLFKFRRGHTEYGVGWMPIGGYVRMFGDPTEVEGEEHDTPLAEITEQDKAEALIYKPAHHKLLVFFAGPLMNIALAFILAPLIFMLGVPQAPPITGLIEPDSPAAIAGIKPGDRIVSIGGKAVNSFRDMMMEEALNPEQTLVYVVDRKGQRLEIPLTLRKSENQKMGPLGESGITEYLSAQVGGLSKDSPAEKAGLVPGDTITRLNDREIGDWADLTEVIGASQGQELNVVALRRGRPLTFKITPQYHKEYQRYLIGIAPFQETEIVKYGLADSMSKGSRYCVEMVAQTYVVLWKLISLKLSPKVMSGPLGIGAITSKAAHSGFAALLGFTVLISINLGILNLLPFPPLDGGHILFTSVETVIRREIKMSYKEMTFRVGFALLLILMALVTVNDFLRYKSDMLEFFKAIGKGLGLG